MATTHPSSLVGESTDLNRLVETRERSNAKSLAQTPLSPEELKAYERPYEPENRGPHTFVPKDHRPKHRTAEDTARFAKMDDERAIADVRYRLNQEKGWTSWVNQGSDDGKSWQR